MKKLMMFFVVVLVSTFTTQAMADGETGFIPAVFEESNLGPKLPGGLRQILDIKKVNANLKKELWTGSCDGSSDGGWEESYSFTIKAKAIYGSVVKNGLIRSFHFTPCEPYYRSDVAIIRPANSDTWYVITDFPTEVQAAQTYGNYDQDNELVIVGSVRGSNHMTSPKVIHIKLDGSDRDQNKVKALGVTDVELPW